MRGNASNELGRRPGTARFLPLYRLAVARRVLEGIEAAGDAARRRPRPLTTRRGEHRRCAEHSAEEERARARFRVHVVIVSLGRMPELESGLFGDGNARAGIDPRALYGYGFFPSPSQPTARRCVAVDAAGVSIVR